jgi:hypothetical protein
MTETQETHGPKTQRSLVPIWFWVGLILTLYGAIITILGVLSLSGKGHGTVLAHLHPDLWWGAIMLLFGLALLLPQIVRMRREGRRTEPGK